MAAKREGRERDRQASAGTGAAPGGLVIIGTESGCGKTVMVTGLAATLREEGFPTRALKPLSLSTAPECQAELSFISTISQTPLSYPLQFASAASPLTGFGWAEALRALRQPGATPLAELPGSAATPLLQNGASWKDTADLAAEIGWPCLLVARAGNEAVEMLLLNAAYLSCRNVAVAAMAVVETEVQPPGAPPTDQEELGLVERVGVPFIGRLRFSPSISVPRVNQGNLIKTTAAGIDLLPVLKALNFSVSA